MSMLAPIILALWGIETVAGAVVGWLALGRFPLTAIVLLFRSGVYIAMALGWYTMGYESYRAGHLATAWAFRALTVLVCLESVWLMAQGIAATRHFAAATSLIFAGIGVLVATATAGVFHGTWMDVALGNNVAAYRNLSVACVVYLLANHWMYEREQPAGTLATQHWRGTVVLVSCLMIGYGMEDWGGKRRIYELVVAGQFVVRIGSLGALAIWSRK